MQWIREKSMPPEDIAAEIFSLISRTVLRMLDSARQRTGLEEALLTGGVASSMLFREQINAICRKRRMGLRLYFGKPQYAGDNAAGVALIGLDRLKEHEK